MAEVVAQLSDSDRSAWEAAIRAEGPVPAAAPPFNPLRPVSAFTSEEEDAIGLVRRGVRVVPFAETLPLLPLYAARGEQLPPELQVAHEQQQYDFHLVSLTFTLALEDNESPDSAEFTVRIQDDVGGARASRAIRVFPERAHSSWFRAEARFNVELDASLAFSASHTAAHANAKATAAAGSAVRVLAGPFTIELGRTELEVLGEGDREVGWRYRVQQALAGKNDYRSLLVLKVARETKSVRLLTEIGVKTYRRSWTSLWLRERLPLLRASAELEVELPRA